MATSVVLLLDLSLVWLAVLPLLLGVVPALLIGMEAIRALENAEPSDDPSADGTARQFNEDGPGAHSDTPLGKRVGVTAVVDLASAGHDYPYALRGQQSRGGGELDLPYTPPWVGDVEPPELLLFLAAPAELNPVEDAVSVADEVRRTIAETTSDADLSQTTSRNAPG